MNHEPLNPMRRQALGPPAAQKPARKAPHRASRHAARRKPRQAELRGRRIGLLVVLSMVLGFELAAAALTSPLFSIDRIVLRGAERVPTDEISATERTAQLPVGTNLFLAPTAQMEARLKLLPWVETARVRWSSSHALSVLLRPREAAAVARIGAQSYELDARGVPIRVARAAMVHQLPQIDVERPINAHFGSPVHDEAVLSAINIYRDALRQPMVRIAKIRVDPDGNMCLNMLDGIQVQLGQPEDLTEKMRYVQRVYELDPNASTRMAVINLSYPKLPACTLKSDIQTHPGDATNSGSAAHEPDSNSEVAF